MNGTKTKEESTDWVEKDHIAKLVVCEDDAGTLELLCDHLTAERYEVLAAPTAADALRLCQFSDPDLLLLDLTLPDASGLDVLREIREPDRSMSRFNPEIGVIVLSGRGSERDRVRGLEQGADDYVVKPFTLGELLARISAVLRRRKSDAAPILKAGDIEIDRTTKKVTVGDREVKLTDREYKLLLALAKDPQKLVAKDDLVRDVLGRRAISGNHTRTIEAHASRLRRKLDPEGASYVINAWGVAYVLTVPDSWSS